MKSPVRTTQFAFPSAAHFKTAMPLIASVRECCEGLFGEEHFRTACVYYMSALPFGIVFAKDNVESKTMEKVLRHVLAKQMRDGSWTVATVNLHKIDTDFAGGRDT
jgi:hypothetical protein